MTKPTKWQVRPAKTQFSLGIRPVWSESSLTAWRKLGSLATHWAHSEDSDQTGRMPRLIWVFAGCKVIMLVLSWGGSYVHAFSGLIWGLDTYMNTLSCMLTIFSTGRGSSIRSEFAWHASGPEFDPHIRHILSWRLGHENISTAILPLPLFQEEQLSVTGERMCTKYW